MTALATPSVRFWAMEVREPTQTSPYGTPCYCWPPEERAPWLDGTTRPLARWAAFATGRRHPFR
jgi:hypothetical protein